MRPSRQQGPGTPRTAGVPPHAQARELAESCPELAEGMTEIEFSLLERACLKGGNSSEEALQRNISIYERDRSAAAATINWRSPPKSLEPYYAVYFLTRHLYSQYQGLGALDIFFIGLLIHSPVRIPSSRPRKGGKWSKSLYCLGRPTDAPAALQSDRCGSCRAPIRRITPCSSMTTAGLFPSDGSLTYLSPPESGHAKLNAYSPVRVAQYRERKLLSLDPLAGSIRASVMDSEKHDVLLGEPGSMLSVPKSHPGSVTTARTREEIQQDLLAAKTVERYRPSITGLKREIGNRLPDVSFHDCRPFR